MREIRLHQNEIQYLIDSVMPSICLGYKSELGNRVLEKLKKAKLEEITLKREELISPMFSCQAEENGLTKCESQCLGCAGLNTK